MTTSTVSGSLLIRSGIQATHLGNSVGTEEENKALMEFLTISHTKY